MCFPGDSMLTTLPSMQETTCNAGDMSLIPGWGICPGEGNGNALQYSCLGNPMDRGVRQVTVPGVARVRHGLSTKPPPPYVQTHTALYDLVPEPSHTLFSYLYIELHISSLEKKCCGSFWLQENKPQDNDPESRVMSDGAEGWRVGKQLLSLIN